jgi:hypothetical protein
VRFGTSTAYWYWPDHLGSAHLDGRHGRDSSASRRVLRTGQGRAEAGDVHGAAVNTVAALPPRVQPHVRAAAAAAGLAETGLHLYGVPQMLKKFHPAVDWALARILQLDPAGLLLLQVPACRTDHHPRPPFTCTCPVHCSALKHCASLGPTAVDGYAPNAP